MLNLLNKSVIDLEKRAFLESITPKVKGNKAFYNKGHDENALCELSESREIIVNLDKICPQCHTKFPNHENFCHKCSVRLIDINKINIEDIEIPHETKSKNIELSEIFTKDNIDKLSNFNFTINDLNQITDNIKANSIKTLDKALKDNNLIFDDLYIRDKILIYAKSFTSINYKSYGEELGNYLLGEITIDDRQSDILQITTLIHELTHFLLTDILAEILSKTLEIAKSNQIKAIAHYILSSNDFFRLLDEYCAHTAESRFTLFGFQDYSSFKNILNDTKLNEDCIEAAKLFGNSYSKLIIKILESVIDRDLRYEIKNEFINDYMTPSYEDLKLETCRILIDEDLISSLNFILNTGFEGAVNNKSKISEYTKRFRYSNP